MGITISLLQQNSETTGDLDLLSPSSSSSTTSLPVTALNVDAVSLTPALHEDQSEAQINPWQQGQEGGSGDAGDDTDRSNATSSKKKASHLSVKETVHKLSTGEYELFERPEFVRGKPCINVSKFRGVWDAKSKALIDAVQCTQCRKVLSAKGSSGVSSFARHLREACPGVVADVPSLIVPPEWAKESITKAAAHYSARGLHPPNHFAGKPMRQLLQAAVNVGAACGSVNANKLVPDPTTVARCISSEAKIVRQQLSIEILPYIEDNLASATTDNWTDDHVQEHYMTITLMRRILVIVNVGTDDEKLTAERLRSEILSKLEQRGVFPHLAHRLVWVSDNGPDVRKALEWWDERLYCGAHALNVSLKNAMCVKYHLLVSRALEACPQAKKLIDLGNTWTREARGQMPPRHKLRRRLTVSNTQSQSHYAMLMLWHDFRQEVRDIIEDPEIEYPDIMSEDILQRGSREQSSNVTTSKCPALLQHVATSEDDSPMITALKNSARESLDIVSAIIILERCKNLVAYLKRADLNKRLSHRAQQEIETRWNSHFGMLYVLDEFWEEIEELLAGIKDGPAKLNCIDRQTVRMLITFLLPFAAHTKKIQGFNYPSLPYVLPAYTMLLEHCQPNLDDSKPVAGIRREALRQLIAELEITMRHKIATFLWPRMKSLKMLSDQKINEVYDAIRAWIEKREITAEAQASLQANTHVAVTLSYFSSSLDVDDPTTAPASSSTAKRLKLAFADEDLYGSLMIEKDVSELDEVDKYARMPEADICNDSDLLAWWKTVGSMRFPHLSKVAREVLATPATSSSSESVFSEAGLLVSDRGSNVSPSTVDDTLILRDYLRNMAK